MQCKCKCSKYNFSIVSSVSVRPVNKIAFKIKKKKKKSWNRNLQKKVRVLESTIVLDFAQCKSCLKPSKMSLQS